MPVEYTTPVTTTMSQTTCKPPCHPASASHRTRMSSRLPSMIQKMMMGRNSRLVACPAAYCGQNTPTARISTIISSRTRASHCSHSRFVRCDSIPIRFYSSCKIRRGKTAVSGPLPSPVSYPAFPVTPGLMHVAEFSDQREQWQIHRDDHAADYHTEKHDHHRFQRRQQVLHRCVHLFFVEVRDFLQHRVHGAGLFAHCDHLRDHAWKYLRILQRFSKRFAFFERLAHFDQCLLDHGVARGFSGDVQTFQNRDAARDQSSQRTSESRDGDFPHQDA